jgi:hypothetical protein
LLIFAFSLAVEQYICQFVYYGVFYTQAWVFPMDFSVLAFQFLDGLHHLHAGDREATSPNREQLVEHQGGVSVQPFLI